MDINNLVKEISQKQASLIEEKIKELIKPYINTNYYAHFLGELERKGYKMECFINGDTAEYRITYMPTGKYDYFVKKEGEIVQGEDFNFSFKTYISDIERGIE